LAANADELENGAQLLARVLLGDVERMAERSAARMQELLPGYARVPRRELIPVLLANTRNLLEAIRDPASDRIREQVDHRASGDARARQGITLDEMLHGWRIGLEVVREEAYVMADELEIGEDALLEFVEVLLRWGDVGMRVSAVAHREAGVRELTRLAEEQASLRRVATLVAQRGQPSHVFDTVAGELAGLLRADHVVVCRYEPGSQLTVLAHRGTSSKEVPPGTLVNHEGGSVEALVRRTKRSCRLESYEGVRGTIAELARAAGVQFAVGAPVLVDGRLWGVASAGWNRDNPPPAQSEERMAKFADLAATAIANAEARAEVERLAEVQAALRRVATLVARGARPEDVFSAVNDEVARLLPVTSAAMGRYEADGTCTTIAAWSAVGGHVFPVGDRWDCAGNHVTGLVLRTGRPARLDDYTNASGPIGIHARTSGYRSAVGSPITVEGRLWGLISAASSAVEPLPADTEARLASFTELVATAIANTESRSRLTRLANEQAALRRVATLVARGAPPVTVFVKVCEEVGPLLGAAASLIDRFDGDGYCTTVGSWGKLREAFEVGSRWKVEGSGGASAQVYRTGQPVRLEYDGPGSIAAEARRVGLRFAVGSPVVVNGRLWASLVVATSEAKPLPVDAEARLAQFAELVATSIANVQARSELAASRVRIITAADEERRRVVRDLHDGAQRHLVHTILTVGLARRALEHDRHGAADLVKEALHHAQAATEELRELAHGILPSALTHAGLAGGIGELAARMPIPVEVDVSIDRLPQETEATAYFIVAEALMNVAKHANAREARVTARLDGRALHVDVRDDGIGGVRSEGTGLVRLRDRLAVLDGSLHVESPPHGGTLITASIPVASASGIL
jgi:signal transduction histidine kinase